MRSREPPKDQTKGKKLLAQSGLKGFDLEPFELDRLKANFFGWLSRSYPTDFRIFAIRPGISENEICDFLKGKGMDMFNIYYLIESFRGG